MKLNELHDKLIAAARKNPPDERVPYAFEKRIMSRVTALPPESLWSVWNGPLWRAALSCAVVTAACGIWLSAQKPAEPQPTFSQAFEAAVFAPPSQHLEDTW